MSPTEIYYETEWKAHCPQKSSFLASWEGLAFYSHSLLIVSLPVYIFTTYCLLRKTPQSMHSVKFTLIVSHFCNGLLARHFIREPELCDWRKSISNIEKTFAMGAQCDELVSVRVVFGTSVRQYSRPSVDKNRVIGAAQQLICAKLMQKGDAEKQSALNCNRLFPTRRRQADCSLSGALCQYYVFTNEDLPCPTAEFFSADVFIFVSAYNWKIYMSLATVSITAFLSVQVVFFIVCCMYYLYFKKTPTTSLQTRNRQKVFLRGSIAQGLVPLICLVIPVFYCCTSVVLNYYNSAINNLMVLMLSTHGFFTEIVILMVHRPYRRFILQLVGRKIKGNVSAPNSVGPISREAANMRLTRRFGDA
uniref:Uncharacterized protein n=1 Tax=Caenorhabditis japonica TaxID=281687 RepID=A0A8R1E278_CAEJA